MYFFFKQKTAYEMRISDWSSDVCSSDLRQEGERDVLQHLAPARIDLRQILHDVDVLITCQRSEFPPCFRSEARRVGKECVSTCSTRCSPSHLNKHNNPILRKSQ